LKGLGKLVVLAIVVIVAIGIFRYFASPVDVVCDRFASLCEIEDADTLDGCREGMEVLMEEDPASARSAADCSREADDCTDVARCGWKVGISAGKKLLPKLIDRALKSL
jgi:hypothetical protein